MENKKMKYIGTYAGTVPGYNISVKPGDVIDVPLDKAEQLLLTTQFEVVEETQPKKAENGGENE